VKEQSSTKLVVEIKLACTRSGP